MVEMPKSWPVLPKNLTTFYQVWQNARVKNGGNIPRRQDLSLMDLRALTPMLTILKLDGPGKMHVRMSGTAMDAMFDQNLTGLNVADVSEPAAAKAMVSFHEALLAHPSAGWAKDLLVSERGKRISAEYLFLPLLDRDGNRVLCASLCDAETTGFGLPSGDMGTRINHKEFMGAKHLDIGFGVPEYSFSVPTVGASVS